MSSISMSQKKYVSSGAATQRIAQQSLVALSLPLAVKRSPTCKVCVQDTTCKPAPFKAVRFNCYLGKRTPMCMHAYILARAQSVCRSALHLTQHQ